MQRSRILSLRDNFKDNILYQVGISETLSLEEASGMTESEALKSLPN